MKFQRNPCYSRKQDRNKKASRNWEEHEFAKLVDSFGGVLYQLDKRTSGRFSYKAAKMRIVICDYRHIPIRKWMRILPNDNCICCTMLVKRKKCMTRNYTTAYELIFSLPKPMSFHSKHSHSIFFSLPIQLENRSPRTLIDRRNRQKMCLAEKVPFAFGRALLGPPIPLPYIPQRQPQRGFSLG